jgi:hypothetical protein
MGIGEMILWPCRHRFISLLIGDILISLILLWTLFYEQYSDKLLLKIKHYLYCKNEGERTQTGRKPSLNEQFIIMTSFQSPVFIMQLIFASLPFIATLLSYKDQSM